MMFIGKYTKNKKGNFKSFEYSAVHVKYDLRNMRLFSII